MPADPRDQVRHAKAALAARLSGVAGITGLGIGKSSFSGGLVVRVTVEDERAAELVPKDCEGVPVEVSISGEFKAQ